MESLFLFIMGFFFGVIGAQEAGLGQPAKAHDVMDYHQIVPHTEIQAPKHLLCACNPVPF